MWKIAALMIFAHGCIDISLTFPAVLVMLAVCIANCRGGRNVYRSVVTLASAFTILVTLSYFTAPPYSNSTYDAPYLQSREAFSDGDYEAAVNYALDALERAPNVPIVYNWARDCAILLPPALRDKYTERIENIHASNGKNPFADIAARAKAQYATSLQTGVPDTA
jgi:hypothetical protein